MKDDGSIDKVASTQASVTLQYLCGQDTGNPHRCCGELWPAARVHSGKNASHSASKKNKTFVEITSGDAKLTLDENAVDLIVEMYKVKLGSWSGLKWERMWSICKHFFTGGLFPTRCVTKILNMQKNPCICANIFD